MSRSSRAIDFPCPDTCTAYHARPYIEQILGVTRQRIYQLIAAGRLKKGPSGCISCQSARRYCEGLTTFDSDLSKPSTFRA